MRASAGARSEGMFVQLDIAALLAVDGPALGLILHGSAARLVGAVGGDCIHDFGVAIVHVMLAYACLWHAASGRKQDAARLQWLSTQRIASARDLLETTNLSMEHIAEKAGMGSATNLRPYFTASVGIPLNLHRKQFRQEQRPLLPAP